MVADSTRNADVTWRTFGLKSRNHVYHVAMKVAPIRNRIANVNGYSEADRAIGWVATVETGICC